LLDAHLRKPVIDTISKSKIRKCDNFQKECDKSVRTTSDDNLRDTSGYQGFIDAHMQKVCFNADYTT